MEGESLARVSLPGQPPGDFWSSPLAVGPHPSVSGTPVQPWSKILNGKFWKEMIFHSFSYHDPLTVSGLVCELSDLPDLHADNMEHLQGHSQPR